MTTFARDAISPRAFPCSRAHGGVAAGLETAKPGNTAEQVEAVWQAVLRRNGLKKESRVGYSVGLAYPPDWGERTVSLRPGDKTELQAGMCFHLIPDLKLVHQGGVVFSESVLVTETGHEALTEFPSEIFFK